MKTLKMCLNWKVMVGLMAAGVGLYFLAPELALAALPILVLAACPLSMMLMMWSMRGTEDKESAPDSEEQLASLREQQMALNEKIDALERTRSAENTGARSDARG